MSLDVYLHATRPTQVFEANITHNLGKMADAVGVYYACWRPDEINATKAKDIIKLLESGIRIMKEKPDYFKTFDAPNGWGTYDQFLPWLEKYLEACKENPDADISVSR